jgi:hypothetical protein
MVPTVAAADDPHDPTMRTAVARTRDREIIRGLNLQELAHVRERDARYAESSRAWRSRSGAASVDPEYSHRSQGYAHAMAAYASDQNQYQRDLSQWRRAVSACRAGDYSACDD